MAGTRLGRVLVGAAALGVGLSTGCSSLSNTATGAGIGGALGAGLGTVVGAATGNPRTGAVAGGLLGAGIGGAAGASEDARERQENRVIQAEAAANQAATASQMQLGDVIQMANGQPPVGDEVIINQLRSTGSTFQLTTSDITYLKQNNVSDRVINEMISARPRVGIAGPRARTVVIREPIPGPVVVYERPWGWYPRPYYYAAPPPVVGFGFHFRR
ncbi:MAG TPA: hypothetical protein VFG68_16730 [Fimbriiglobus sp.]|nr:hypothetical protein [Fimbriiglobus sp.]